MGYATPAVKMLKVKKTAGEPAYEPSVANTLAKTYPIARSLAGLYAGRTQGAVKNYIDWILSEAGQKVVEATGYVPAARLRRARSPEPCEKGRERGGRCDRARRVTGAVSRHHGRIELRKKSSEPEPPYAGDLYSRPVSRTWWSAPRGAGWALLGERALELVHLPLRHQRHHLRPGHLLLRLQGGLPDPGELEFQPQPVPLQRTSGIPPRKSTCATACWR